MLDRSSFLAFYPQFQSFSPGVVLTEYLAQANARFSDFGEDAEEARRLYVAHRLTLYAAALPESSGASMAAVAAAGRTARQEVSSKKVGEVSVSYTQSSAASGVSTGLRDLPETIYGLELLSLIRLHGFSRYIP